MKPAKSIYISDALELYSSNGFRLFTGSNDSTDPRDTLWLERFEEAASVALSQSRTGMWVVVAEEDPSDPEDFDKATIVLIIAETEDLVKALRIDFVADE